MYEAYNLPGVDFTRDFIAVYNFWGKFCRDMGITNEENFVKWVVAWYRGERVEIPGLPPDQYKTEVEANAEIEAELQKEMEEDEREERMQLESGLHQLTIRHVDCGSVTTNFEPLPTTELQTIPPP